MRFVGKLFHKLQSFTEFKDLELEINELQKLDSRILGGLQQAFGQAMNEYARTQDTRLREALSALQEICRTQLLELRHLISLTTGFPTELTVLNGLHDEMSRKRAELREKQELYDKYTRESSQALANLEKARTAAKSGIEISKSRSSYDSLCALKQAAYEALENKKKEVDEFESSYHQSLIKVVTTALETFATANMNSMIELGRCGDAMKEVVDRLDDSGSSDPAIAELQARRILLEKELNE
jgi:hypothetical protein